MVGALKSEDTRKARPETNLYEDKTTSPPTTTPNYVVCGKINSFLKLRLYR